MNWQKQDYDDIPGTYVFDGQRAHPAYAINKLLYTFNDEACRAEFDADPAAYCDKMGVTSDFKKAVLAQGFTTGNHADYEPGRRFYFHDADGIEYEVVQYD